MNDEKLDKTIAEILADPTRTPLLDELARMNPAMTAAQHAADIAFAEGLFGERAEL